MNRPYTICYLNVSAEAHIDGDPASHTLFLRSEGMESKPVALRLISAEVAEGDGLMVTYAPKTALPNH